MRIRELEFDSIYPFDTFRLDFGSSGPGLHILYGPNEAGKSTLRQLLLDLLFGGKINDSLRARYDSRSRMEGVLESSGRLPFHIKRKKRSTKLLLTDGTGAEISEDLLVPYLSGYDKERFSLLFGFDHVRLREGGESLLKSGGHAGVSLFEAGGGIQYLQGLLTSLSDRATSLLDPRFTKTSTKLINKALRAYNEAEIGVRTNSLRGEDWQQLSEEITRTRQKLSLLQEDKLQIRKELSKLQRIMRVHRHVERYQALCTELESMSDTPVLAAGLEDEIKGIIQAYELSKRELLRQEDTYNLHKTELKNILLDDKALQLEEDITRLGENLSYYLGLKDEDTPLLRQKLTLRNEEAKRLLQEISPDIAFDDVERLRIPFAVEEETIHLSEDIKKARMDRDNAHSRCKEFLDGVKTNEHELKQIGTIADITKLRQIVQEIREKGDLEETVRRKKLEIEQKAFALDMKLKSQQLWSGAKEGLLTIPVPLQETLDVYQKAWMEMTKELADCERDLSRVQVERNNLVEQLQALELTGHVPIESELQEARDHRDTGWQLIRQVWLEHQEEPPGIHEFCEESGTLADTFEAAVKKVDEISDWMRKESDRSAQRSHMLLQKEQLDRKIEELTLRVKELQENFDALSLQWKDEWDACEIVPKSPVEMKEWVVNYYRPVLDGLGEIQGLQSELTELAGQKDRYAALALQCLAELNVLLEDDGLGLRQLVTLCEKKIAEVDKEVQKELVLKDKLKEANRRFHGAEETANEMEGLVLKLESRWKAVRTSYPFLPESPDIAIRYIHRVHEMFQKIDDVHGLEHEIATKEETCNAFETSARKLMQDLGEDANAYLSLTAFVRSAKERLSIAKEVVARKEEKQKAAQQLEEEISRIRLETNHHETTLKTFQSEYGCSDIETLRVTIDRFEAYKQILNQQKQVEDHLLEAGDGIEIAKLVLEVKEITDFDELPPKMDALEKEIEALDNVTNEVQKHLWEQKQKFDALDGSRAEAAASAQEAEHHLAGLDPLWNEYLRVELAKRLLSRSIDQFRRKNESLVLDASSAFFAKLTLSHYTGLSIEYEDDEPFLEAIANTGEKRRVTQMSDGTRDQLFLALRLAFLEQHLTSSEPLPLIMDDILVHFDDKRTEATLEILNQFASQTQILYFTHHQSVVDAVARIPDASQIRVHHLVHQLV